MQHQELSWPQIDALPRDTVVVLPVAAIEQHGPHLPVGVDSMIAQGVVDALDAACDNNLLVLPVQRFGCSEHHMGFAGTLTLTHEIFEQVAMQIIDAMVRHGFTRFLILNAHGGNRAIGGVMAEKASSRWPDAQVVFATWFQLAAERIRPLVEGAFPSVGHACEFETSVMLLLHPELVDMSKAEDDGLPPPQKQLQNDLLTGAAATKAIPFNVMTRKGAFGRPTLASREKGQRVLNETVAALKQLVEDIWPGAV